MLIYAETDWILIYRISCWIFTQTVTDGQTISSTKKNTTLIFFNYIPVYMQVFTTHSITKACKI